MRDLPAIILSVSVLQVLVIATPAPAAVAIGAVLTAPRTNNGGFSIPDEATDGFYAVHIDEQGVSYHTKIADSSTLNDAAAVNRLAPHGPPNVEYFCAGYEMNHDESNYCVEMLARACGNSLYTITAGDHYYWKNGASVAFICNFSSTNVIWCDYNGVISAFKESIPAICGAWMAGWMDYGDPRWSIGQHWIGAGCNFCGKTHC